MKTSIKLIKFMSGQSHHRSADSLTFDIPRI